MSPAIKQAVEIIDQRIELSNCGKGEMPFSEYFEIKRLLELDENPGEQNVPVPGGLQ